MKKKKILKEIFKKGKRNFHETRNVLSYIWEYFMPGLHSCLEYLSRLNKTETKYHESKHSHSGARIVDNKATFKTFSFPLTRDWFTGMFPRALRQDENRSRVWKMRQMYPFTVSFSSCLDEDVNQALKKLYLNINEQSIETNRHVSPPVIVIFYPTYRIFSKGARTSPKKTRCIQFFL